MNPLPTPSFHIEITRSKLDRLDKPLFGASHGLCLDFMGNLAMNVVGFGQGLGRDCFAFRRWAMKLLRVVRPGGFQASRHENGCGQEMNPY